MCININVIILMCENNININNEIILMILMK